MNTKREAALQHAVTTAGRFAQDAQAAGVKLSAIACALTPCIRVEGRGAVTFARKMNQELGWERCTNELFAVSWRAE